MFVADEVSLRRTLGKTEAKDTIIGGADEASAAIEFSRVRMEKKNQSKGLIYRRNDIDINQRRKGARKIVSKHQSIEFPPLAARASFKPINCDE